MTNYADCTELADKARTTMAPDIWSYVSHGAGDEFTQSNNEAAFQKLGVLPRILRATAQRDLSVELCGMSGLAALDLLPGVVAAADGMPVLFDSGIRSGADVVKALALDGYPAIADLTAEAILPTGR